MPEAREAVLEDPYVLLHREKISAIADLLPLLEKVIADGKPLLIVAEDVEGEALSTLVVNAIRKTFTVVAVKSPFFGDRRKAFLEDLAIVTGARGRLPRGRAQAREVGLDVLGRVRRVVVTKDATTSSTVAAPSDVAAPGRAAHREIEDTDSDWDREKLQERLAKLAGGVAVIKVGAATEIEAQGAQAPHRGRGGRHRAAVDEGIIAGGGAALVHAAAALADGLGLTGDEATGVAIVRQRCARRCTGSPRTAVKRVGRDRQGAELPAGSGLQRRDPELRRPARRGRRRPGEGDPLGAASTRRRSRGCAHHGERRGRQARAGGAGPRAGHGHGHGH